MEKSLALQRKTRAALKQPKCDSYTPQPHPMTTTETVHAQMLQGNSPSLRRGGARHSWDPVCALLGLQLCARYMSPCSVTLGRLHLFPTCECVPEICDVSLVAGWDVWQVAGVG